MTPCYFKTSSLARLTSVGTVELDAEVSVRTTGVVAGGEDNPAHCFMFPNQTGHCRGRKDAVLAHNQPLYLQTTAGPAETVV